MVTCTWVVNYACKSLNIGVGVSVVAEEHWRGICEWYVVLACKLIVQVMEKILFIADEYDDDYQYFMDQFYDDEKESWRILTNKEIYAMVKKPTIAKTIRLNRLR